MDYLRYGIPQPQQDRPDGLIPARVLSVHKQRYGLICRYGETYGRLKTKQYYLGGELFPTTGDFVLIAYLPGSDSQIVQTLPRRTFFSRRDPSPGRGEQAVAANFDAVWILQSLNADFNEKRLDRYLTLAWQSGAAPAVLLTKCDLTDDPTPQIAAVSRRAPGVPVYAVSAQTGQGLDALQAHLGAGRTLVFLGSSGVGKSSLVNALAGKIIMDTAGIRESDSKGRHTTTHRQLVLLDDGTMIIDTPGMRELGMWDVTNGLGAAFEDVQAFLGQCRFADCTHQNEPGCAVRAALESGQLAPDRWESYCKIHREARYGGSKIERIRDKDQRSKAISKHLKALKKQRP